MDKKASIIFIKEILDRETNSEHKLSLSQIQAILKDRYDLDLDTKAIGRNIHCLMDKCGYDIISTRNGFYIEDRELDNTELKFLVDQVLTNRFIPRHNTDQLINKIYNLTGPKLREITPYIKSYNSYSKTGNKEVFLNIELIEEAISKNSQISFKYCDYILDKKLTPRHDGKEYKVSPYRLIVKQQRYYLMCKDMEKNSLVYYKLDKMINVKILNIKSASINTLPSFTHGINDQVLHDYLPYAFSDKPEEITIDVLNLDAGVDTLCEWFGDNLTFTTLGEGKIRARVKASPKAMSYFALQYIQLFKVVAPRSLVDDIKSMLNFGVQTYNC